MGDGGNFQNLMVGPYQARSNSQSEHRIRHICPFVEYGILKGSNYYKLSYDRELNCMTLKRKRSTNVNNLTALKYILLGKFSGSRQLK